MQLIDLNPPEQRFVTQLAELNALQPERALELLLNPRNRQGGWQAGVELEGGALVGMKLGFEGGYGYAELKQVPDFDLPQLRSAVIVGGCQLGERATLLGDSLTVLNVNSQKTLVSLTTGPALQTLSVLGNPSLERVDITGSPLLEDLQIFELPRLVAGLRCWDVQRVTVRGLGRLGKRIDSAGQLQATPELLRRVTHAFEHAHDWWSRVGKAVLAHPNCPVDVALQQYLSAARGVYPRATSLARCDDPRDKAMFRAARQVEKRGLEGWSPAPIESVDLELDVGGWARAPSAALLSALGVTVVGAPTPKTARAASKPRVKHMTEAQALATFGDWIAHPLEYGQPAESLEVVYRKILPWGDGETKAYLVRWTMQNGDSFVGITGPFTWSFMGLEMGRLDPLKAATRYRRLMNLYFGWYLCFCAAQLPEAADLQANSLDSEGMQQAFPRDLATVGIHLGRSEVTEGAELLGSTWATGVKGRDCQLRCLRPPQVYVEPTGRRHYVVDAEITYAYGGGTVKASYRLYLHGNSKGRLEKRAQHLPLGGHGVLDDLALYHFVGSQFGPFDFRNMVGGLSLFDH